MTGENIVTEVNCEGTLIMLRIFAKLKFGLVCPRVLRLRSRMRNNTLPDQVQTELGEF